VSSAESKWTPHGFPFPHSGKIPFWKININLPPFVKIFKNYRKVHGRLQVSGKAEAGRALFFASLKVLWLSTTMQYLVIHVKIQEFLNWRRDHNQVKCK
jgi:hypothetical protein